MELFTITIATIGFASGLASIVMHFYTYSLSRAKVKVVLDKTVPSYIFKSSEFKIKNIKTDYCAVVSLKISNASSLPVTIDNIVTFYNKEIMRHKNDFQFWTYGIPITENETTVTYNPSKGLELPLRIEGFDTVYGCLKLPFADCLKEIRFDKDESAKLKIAVSTPRNTISLWVNLYEYHSFHKGLRPE